ncbi:MAG: HAD-IA family hydrolase [Hyphomicrobium sp.]|nr:HAD-IA family hydrolase [Hyphomicrobium sp.]
MSGRTAILFDLDGTLVDSVGDIARVLDRVLLASGREAAGVDKTRSWVGGGARQLVERALGMGADASAVDRLYRAFLEAYEAEPVVDTVLFPGALSCLDELAAQGCALGVVTNKPEALAVTVLERLGIMPIFGIVVGGRDGVPVKPAPDMMRIAIRGLDCRPAGTALVGDSKADVGAARAAGCLAVVVRGGYTNIPAENLGADLVVDGLGAVPGALHRLHFRGSRPEAVSR